LLATRFVCLPALNNTSWQVKSLVSCTGWSSKSILNLNPVDTLILVVCGTVKALQEFDYPSQSFKIH